MNTIKHPNTLRKVIIVQNIINENFEPGRHDKSLRNIYLTKIFPILPISERTFYRYMGICLDDYKEMAKNTKCRRRVKPIILD